MTSLTANFTHKSRARWYALVAETHTIFGRYVPAQSEVELHIWRRCEEKRVYYEWAVTQPLTGPVNNLNGRSFSIGM